MRRHVYEIKLWPESYSTEYLMDILDRIKKNLSKKNERIIDIEHWRGYSGEFYTWIHAESDE